jgi:hypothetical protein
VVAAAGGRLLAVEVWDFLLSRLLYNSCPWISGFFQYTLERSRFCFNEGLGPFFSDKGRFITY